jgi:regulator of telomere elongation helicase 1
MKSSIKVNGIDVSFPFKKPYTCQIDIMKRIIECVSNGVNGLIESPTGTGKTLSILCASIAALQSLR